jgi:sulfide:quinone oxidoreductase
VGRAVVCVVGGGTAGLEGLLAARAELGDEHDLLLLAPEREFRYRPMSRRALFRPARERGLPMADVVARARARWIPERVDVVDESTRRLTTRDGDRVAFDYVLLAPGARAGRALRQGHVWRRGEDPAFLDRLLADLAQGRVRSVAVAVPRGARWPLPAYELALVLGWSASPRGARVVLATAEQAPLRTLGREAGQLVARELAEAGVETIAGVEPVDRAQVLEGRVPAEDDPVELLLAPEREAGAGALMAEPTHPARVEAGAARHESFDRLISLATTMGPFIGGVATDAAGFVEVDDTLRVCGSERVWAVGACVSCALEHSALAACQADVAVAAIAAAAGESHAAPEELRVPELTGLLLSEQRERWLAENPPGTVEPSTRCLWWPPGRAVGRMLAGEIEALDPELGVDLGEHPSGLAVHVPVALGCDLEPAAGAAPPPSEDVRAARLRDLENRQLLAIRRRELAADAEVRELSARLGALRQHQRKAIAELRRHGYLRDRNR